MPAMNQFAATVGVGEDGAVTLALEGEIDLAVAATLHDMLVAAGSGARIVRLSMAAVTLLDSSGIAVLATYGKELASLGGRLQVTDRPYIVDRVLEIAGFGASNQCFDVL